MPENTPLDADVMRAVEEVRDVLRPEVDVPHFAAFVADQIKAAPSLGAARSLIAGLREADSAGSTFQKMPPVVPGSFEAHALAARRRRGASTGVGLGQPAVETEDQMRRRIAAGREAAGLARHAAPPPAPPTMMDRLAAMTEARRRMAEASTPAVGLTPTR